MTDRAAGIVTAFSLVATTFAVYSARKSCAWTCGLTSNTSTSSRRARVVCVRAPRRDALAGGRCHRHRVDRRDLRDDLRGNRIPSAPPEWRWALTVSAIVAAPALVGPQYIVHNAVAVFCPRGYRLADSSRAAWMRWGSA